MSAASFSQFDKNFCCLRGTLLAELLWGALGLLWGALEFLWGALGLLLGSFGVPLGSFGVPLGSFWGALRLLLGSLGRPWGARQIFFRIWTPLSEEMLLKCRACA